jgi:hypothetical protein
MNYLGHMPSGVSLLVHIMAISEKSDLFGLRPEVICLCLLFADMHMSVSLHSKFNANSQHVPVTGTACGRSLHSEWK